MTQQEFEQVLEERLAAIRKTLASKGKEYAIEDNPLHNFEKGAAISGQSRERVLWGFALKHEISILDMIDRVDDGFIPTKERTEEKIGDLINYLILLEASLKDRVEESFAARLQYIAKKNRGM